MFMGKQNQSLKYLHSKIDYSTDKLDERKKIVDDILKELENGIDLSNISQEVNYLLERLANYLIYSSRKEWRRRKNREKRINKKEVLVEDVNVHIETMRKKVEDRSTYNLNPQITIFKNDIIKYKDIRQVYHAIHLYQNIKVLAKNRKNIFLINRAISYLRNDAKLIKKSLVGLIEPNNIITDCKEKYSFDNDTGYFDEDGNYVLVSENQLDYGNKKHIYHLIKFYSALKQENYENNQSDIKHILFFLEYLIDNAEITNRERDIVIWTIDGFSQDEICGLLKEKYGLNWYGDTLSRSFDSICGKIADFYEKDYEDWFYTFVAKGKYKTCSKCGQVKLANERYFYKREDSADGLHNICIKCMKIKDLS